MRSLVGMEDCLCRAKEIHEECIELAGLPPFIEIENKMISHITFKHTTALSIINNDKRKLMCCTLPEVG